MASQKLKSARAIAVEVLNRCDPKRNYANSILDAMRHETDQSQRATDLVFGTLRNRRAIDAVIATFSGRPIERIQSKLLNVIRIGTYELIYCPSTEQYAIVNEAVVNTKAVGAAKQSGFVNAVLRQIARQISNRHVVGATLCGCPGQAHGPAPTKDDTKRTLPQSPTTGCRFDTSFLPDPRINPAEYLSTVFSLPEWLIADWLIEFGEESTRQICFASNRRPSVYIRPNRLTTTIESLTEKIGAAEIGFEIVPDVEMIRIKSPRDVTQLPGFSAGKFTIQDITASKPVRLLNPKSCWTILDLCAAPGTKTTQLAEVTGDSTKIISTDIDNRRLEMVKENITRLGINSVDVIPYEELPVIFDCRMPNADFQIENRKPKIENTFDCVLLDVPCSNTGVLARRVEARYRISQETIGKLAEIQGELLRTATVMIKPDGKICYSTCSIQKCENNELVKEFLKQNQNFTLESEQLTLPSAEGFDHDGGYAAILTKLKT